MEENNKNDIFDSENNADSPADATKENTPAPEENDTIIEEIDVADPAETQQTQEFSEQKVQQNNFQQNQGNANNSQPYYQNVNYQPYYNQQYSQQPNYYSNQYYSGTPDNNDKGKKKGLKITLIIVASILTVALVFGVVSIFMDAENPLNQAEGLTGDGTVITTAPTPTGEVVDSVKVAEIGRSTSVGILVYSSNGYSQTEAGEGTGVVASLSADGKSTYIITCAHVISDSGVSVEILLEDGTTYDAAIVGFDLQTDIGVLKVETSDLTCAQFGDSEALKVGSPIYAVGNPGGSEFFGSVTSGIVSSISRSINNEIGYTMDCIQHDAAINPGNSGGALLNDRGQVIGINSSKIASTEYEGMSFAIPISTALEVANQLIENGYVPDRPKLGITYSLATSHNTYAMIVRIKGLPEGSLIIRSIASDSDLNNSDVLVGDMIIAVNGQSLDTPDVLLDIIDSSKVGDELEFTICRVSTDYSVEEFDVTAKLVEDKGSTAVEEETTYINPFDYFEQYSGGYGE